MLTDERVAWISHDHGKKWKKSLLMKRLSGFYPASIRFQFCLFPDGVQESILTRITVDSAIAYTLLRPQPCPTEKMLQIMQFHPNPKLNEWIIWMGGKNCESFGDPDCHTVAYVSQKNGRENSWESLLPYVKKCTFVWRETGRGVKDEQVFCEQHTNEEMGQPLELVSSDDWFSRKDVKFKSVVEFCDDVRIHRGCHKRAVTANPCI